MKNNERTLKGAIKRCDAYIAEDYEDNELFDRIMGDDIVVDDRACAIIKACELENDLEHALRDKFNADRGRRLFSSMGALRSYSNKINVAYALDMFGDETYTNLEVIRTVRNVFAHAKRPASFRTSEISEICAYLIVPTGELYSWSVASSEQDTRARYEETCWKTGFLLNRLLDIGQKPRML